MPEIVLEEEEDVPFVELSNNEIELCEDEQQSLYYFCGRTVREVKKRHKLCEIDVSTLSANTSLECENVAGLTYKKSYVDTTDRMRSPLLYPSEPIFQLLRKAETYFRTKEDDILCSKILLPQLVQYFSKSAQNITGVFPTCHDVVTKLLTTFFRS